MSGGGGYTDFVAERHGIGCGVFVVLVGVGLFAERVGWIAFDMDWLLPAALVAIGAGMIYKAATSSR